MTQPEQHCGHECVCKHCTSRPCDGRVYVPFLPIGTLNKTKPCEDDTRPIAAALNELGKDPCLYCKYKPQGTCAYFLDGRKQEDACMDKLIYIKWMVKHAPIAAKTPVSKFGCESYGDKSVCTGTCFHYSSIPNKMISQRDTAIRREERDRIFKYVRVFVQEHPLDGSCPFDKMNSPECIIKDGQCEVCVVDHAIRSLRDNKEK